MKKLLWILVVLLAIACVAAWFRPHEPLSAEIRTETKIKTVVKVDTMLISAPMAVFWRFVPDDTTRIGDTLLHRRQVVYSDSSYRAVVSGYVDPRLDSLQIFPKTVYQTVTNDIPSSRHQVEEEAVGLWFAGWVWLSEWNVCRCRGKLQLIHVVIGMWEKQKQNVLLRYFLVNLCFLH